jgi:hypothetical protein
MYATTEKLWATQDRHQGDRYRLFAAVAQAVDADRVLYPGSYVDIAPSMLFPDVTYVDKDKRFPNFFGDEAGVRDIVDPFRGSDDAYTFDAIHADYRNDLPIKDESMDLLLSLYSGFVSEHCTRYLRVGGTLLVNPSHGDASLASIDERYELTGVITSRSGGYIFDSTNLDSYFVQRRDEPVTVERLHELGRSIGYTKSAFAYLFTRTS